MTGKYVGHTYITSFKRAEDIQLTFRQRRQQIGALR